MANLGLAFLFGIVAAAAAGPTITKLSCDDGNGVKIPLAAPTGKCYHDADQASDLTNSLCGGETVHVHFDNGGDGTSTFTAVTKFAKISHCDYPVGSASAEAVTVVSGSTANLATSGALNDISALKFPTTAEMVSEKCGPFVLLIALNGNKDSTDTIYDSISVPYMVSGGCTEGVSDLKFQAVSTTKGAAVEVAHGAAALTPSGGWNAATLGVDNLDGCNNPKAVACVSCTRDSVMDAAFLNLRKSGQSAALAAYKTKAAGEPLFERVLKLGFCDLAHEVPIVDAANGNLNMANVFAPFPKDVGSDEKLQCLMTVQLDPLKECTADSSDRTNNIEPFPIKITGLQSNQPPQKCSFYPSALDNGVSAYLADPKAGKEYKYSGGKMSDAPAYDFDKAVDNVAHKMTGLSADGCGKHCKEFFARVNGIAGINKDLVTKLKAVLEKVEAQVTVMKEDTSTYPDDTADLAKYESLAQFAVKLTTAAVAVDGDAVKMGKWLFSMVTDFLNKPADGGDSGSSCSWFNKATDDFSEALRKCSSSGCQAASSFLAEVSTCVCSSVWGTSPGSGELCGASKWDDVKALAKAVAKMLVQDDLPEKIPKKYSQLATDLRAELYKVDLKAVTLAPIDDAASGAFVDKISAQLDVVLGKHSSSDGKRLPELAKALLALLKADGGSVTALTEFLKEIQKLSLDTSVGCELGSTPGDAPTEAEFCFHLRSHKYATELKCRVGKETNGNEPTKPADAMYNLKDYALRLPAASGTCAQDPFVDTVPVVWKMDMTTLKRAAFCSKTGSWHWMDVASCGCENC